jgi:hypothetical protein
MMDRLFKTRKPSVKMSTSHNQDITKKLISSHEAPSAPISIKREYNRPASSAAKSNNSSQQLSYNPTRPDQRHVDPVPSEHEMVSKGAALLKKAAVREGYKWDFCIVVTNPDFDDGSNAPKTEKHPDHISHEEILERLQLAGLEVYPYYSGDGDEIIIKIRAPLERLQARAVKTGIRMLLDDDYVEKYIDDPESPIQEDFDISKYRRYEFIYAPFTINSTYFVFPITTVISPRVMLIYLVCLCDCR